MINIIETSFIYFLTTAAFQKPDQGQHPVALSAVL